MGFLDQLNTISQAFSGVPRSTVVRQQIPQERVVAITPPKKGLAEATENNPFFIGTNSEHPKFSENYGKNNPLPKPAFLGYRGNNALYGGGKLFILY